MATIEKHGGGYRIVVSNGYDSNKKQIRLKSDTWVPDSKMTPKQIEKYLDKFKVNFEDQVKEGFITSGGTISFVKLSEQFLKDSTVRLSNSTRVDYKKRLELRITPSIGHLKIANILTPDVNNYCKMIKDNYTSKDGRNKHLSDSSILKDRAVISSILSYAVEQGHIKINPLIYSGKQTKKKGKKEYKVKYYQPEELTAFLWALENNMPVYRKAHKSKSKNGNLIDVKEYSQSFKVELKWKLFLYISLFCGNRRGEGISLQWNDLDFENNMINFKESTEYVDGKMSLKETKTGNTRDNAVPNYVIELAKQLKAEQIQLSMALGDKWEGFRGKDFNKNFVFITDTGSQMHICSPYRKYKTIIKIYNEYAERNDLTLIPSDVSLHGLRHSTAALLISNDLDPRSVADILGHSNPSTTLNIYSYFFKDKGIAAANILEKELLSK